ncbi:cell wall-binding repeat-containing protein [Clostridium sp. ATCC 25772]|uniref:cell wall-binding repeat-containing protein n=1 Tax=Clostridium sp. ATCC 25772 TaxID=1676991 RepID=UPI0007806E24|nr:cell wall-binding repeat-containing protein [Clostridium sp. ATCC 25772]
MSKNLKIKIIALGMILTSLSIGSTNAFAETKSNKERIYGQDRIETSVQISKHGWENGSDSVVIAAAYDFADALSAAPLAKKNNGPIILNGKSSLPVNTVNEIKRLNPKKVFILGGEKAISKEVEKQLKDIGISQVERIFGKTRYETSLKVAEKLGKVDSAFVTNGQTYADALSVSSIAASMNAPILYTEKDKLKSDVKNYINENEISKAYFIGGNGVLSDDVLKDIKNSERISGENRYMTNKEVLTTFKSQLNFDNVYFVSSTGFADALSVAPMASNSNSSIILTNQDVEKPLEDYINNNITSKSKLIAIGGEKVVPESILDKFISDFDVIEIATNFKNLFV